MSPKSPSGISPTRSEKGVAAMRWSCSGSCCALGVRRPQFWVRSSGTFGSSRACAAEVSSQDRPSRFANWRGQSRRFSPGRLLSCLAAIHQTDLTLKGAHGVPSELALERPGDRPRQLTARPSRTPARGAVGMAGVPGYRGGRFAGSARSESILALGEAGDASARSLLRDRPLRRSSAKDALGGLDCRRRLSRFTRCQRGPSALDRRLDPGCACCDCARCAWVSVGLSFLPICDLPQNSRSELTGA